MHQLEILYRDDYLVAVNKPAGIMVHRSRIAAPRERFVLQMLRAQVGQRVYPVHRLDRPTSGALLFALDRASASEMTGRFARKEIEKTYVAVVRGFVAEEGRIELPLRADVYKGPNQAVIKPAQTLFRRLAQIEVPYPVGKYSTARYSLLEVRPVTGRMHQIRRHLRDIAHPVIGDTRHGDSHHNRFVRETLGCRRLLLASVRLEFSHPITGQPVSITAPLGPRFCRLIRRFDWQDRFPSSWAD
ncbi:MAG: pseudouridylate synthase [Desulfobacterales bacterium]|nr:pseudouridylate synthase [Desulfobacterales bacterium]